jgi:hypothetical protein
VKEITRYLGKLITRLHNALNVKECDFSLPDKGIGLQHPAMNNQTHFSNNQY